MAVGVDHVEILVEEPSMEVLMCDLVPRILGQRTFSVYSHQGKADLLKRLPERLAGYRKWLPPTWRILIVVDRDDDDCQDLKRRLEALAAGAGLATRTTSPSDYQVVNRLAIEELEAWFFGDWDAVRAAYPRVPRTVPSQARYRSPDAIAGGTWEALERILQRAGYFQGGLAKIQAARKIAAHMDPQRNTSQSFRAFHQALVEMA